MVYPHVLLITSLLLGTINCQQEESPLALTWSNVRMPTTSYFRGFSPPSDPARWQTAIDMAASGQKYLLDKVLSTIQSPGEILSFDVNYKWPQKLADLHMEGAHHDTFNILNSYHGFRAPIVHFGWRTFDRNNNEGNMQKFDAYGPNHLVHFTDSIPRKFVGIGAMDQNWGWLSTYFLNRTVAWAFRLDGRDDKFSAESNQDLVQAFLDNENLIMLLVNQHCNITHPKVLSAPLGVVNNKEIWSMAHRIQLASDSRKKVLLYTAGSNYKYRPAIRECVKHNMGEYFDISNAKLDVFHFYAKVSKSIAVLCLPGLGYDTYRIWETLLLGYRNCYVRKIIYPRTMPVIERGVGLDRTLWKLPAIIVDDFAELTPAYIQGAYVEALYRLDEWEFERLTYAWWERLLYQTSIDGNSDYLLKNHPMSAVDAGFTRPLVPFDCDRMGGCGAGTKRTPRRSCAVDPTTNFKTYDWIKRSRKRI